tara:strand:+ start:193 stop:426 length:234 start_codon:yes stop_codon:yes gene_type:complete
MFWDCSGVPKPDHFKAGAFWDCPGVYDSHFDVAAFEPCNRFFDLIRVEWHDLIVLVRIASGLFATLGWGCLRHVQTI